jgi:hypothetical protein
MTILQRGKMICSFFYFFFALFSSMHFFLPTSKPFCLCKQKQHKVILKMKDSHDETYREIDLSEGDVVKLKGCYYLEVYSIQKVQFHIGFRKEMRSEIKVRLFEQCADQTQKDLWQGYLSSWPKNRPFEQLEILKTLGIILLITE